MVVSPKKRASLIIVTAVWCSAARPPETAEWMSWYRLWLSPLTLLVWAKRTMCVLVCLKKRTESRTGKHITEQRVQSGFSRSIKVSASEVSLDRPWGRRKRRKRKNEEANRRHLDWLNQYSRRSRGKDSNSNPEAILVVNDESAVKKEKEKPQLSWRTAGTTNQILKLPLPAN